MNKKITGILGLLLLAGCLAETGNGPVNVIPHNSPVETSKGIRHQAQGNIIGEFHERRPTDPGKWRKLNEAQTNALRNLR